MHSVPCQELGIPLYDFAAHPFAHHKKLHGRFLSNAISLSVVHARHVVCPANSYCTDGLRTFPHDGETMRNVGKPVGLLHS